SRRRHTRSKRDWSSDVCCSNLIILDRVELFNSIEKASIEDFIYRDYFEAILNIWSEIGEIKPTQVKAIKSFSINYAKNSYRGVRSEERRVGKDCDDREGREKDR